MSQFCPFCGHSLRERSRFCPLCGKHLAAPGATEVGLLGNGYRIVHSLSKGGMGAVYLAEDQRAFDRLCVIKQMLEYYDAADPQERRRAHERFEEEGRTLASLSHPGIPKIYAFFVEDGRYYIVMEHIKGETLETFVTHLDAGDQVVKSKRLPLEEVVRHTIGACRILEHLHSQARPVLHQDIKPANLILESQLGEVRLVDFGTARVKIPAGTQLGDGRDSSIYGTDGYAPPEQYRGKPVPKSDVFALAATAYHLLTDDDPRDHPFKWPQLNTLPRELALALKRALRSDPKRRSTARELRQALETMIMPKRTLQVFTFPGGAQIKSVGALPSLCDEHWDVARSFLYKGDFQRWLRDINRHDLVLAADEIVKLEENRDAGLESFLNIVDEGLRQPKVVVDQPTVDLGSVARESALLRSITALNVTRGYAIASVASSEPWLEVYTQTLHLWAGIPADVRINVRAENLPFRSKQRGLVTIKARGQSPILVPVTARVSLVRESWRIVRQALSAALPGSWRAMRGTWRLIARVTRTIGKPFADHPLLFWFVWALLSVATGFFLYYLPEAASMGSWGQLIQRPVFWTQYVPPILLGPPVLLGGLWAAGLMASLTISSLFGFVKGAWTSFVR